MVIFVFLFGLAVGSFLNAVIYRLEAGDSALRGRSYCPRCKHVLSWQDLVPVLSFVMLRGKCRYCKGQISPQYPLVEICTAGIFLLSFKFQVSSLNQASSAEILNILYLWIISSFLIVLFVYDLKHYILPDKILFPAIGVVLGYRVSEFLKFENWDLFGIWSLVFGALGAASFFLAIFLISRGKAMGFGDVKLALFMGLFLGWPNILVALFVAFMLGGAVGGVLILLRKKHMKSEIPFGPFLIAGTFAALFWGQWIIHWYLRLIWV